MKILLHYRHFPVAMGRYIHWALQELGHEVTSCGYYSAGKIPWGEEYYYPEHKYPPDIRLPDVETYPIKSIEGKYDVVIQAGDTHWLEGDPGIKNVIIATDPHVIDYKPRLKHATHFFCMQNHYLKNYRVGEFLPYAYDHNIHIYMPDEPINYDVVLSGLQYPNRVEFMKTMASKGYRVFNALGRIYDEYATVYNQGKIAFNWSSQQDLPARFWEGLAMRRLVLTNRVPDLQEFPDLVEDRDYVAYSTMDEAVEKAEFYLKHDDKRDKIAAAGYKHVQPHTWVNRMKYMMRWLI